MTPCRVCSLGRGREDFFEPLPRFAARVFHLTGQLFRIGVAQQVRRIHGHRDRRSLDQIVASGGHLWACRLSADMNHLTEEDLRDDVEGIISASDFIEMTAGAQLLFI